MRAILIDPIEKSFTEVDYNGDWKTIYKHLDCDLFDDEGLMKSDQQFFHIRGMSQPFAGRGLVFGPTDDEGGTTPATISIEELELQVKFMTPKKVMEMFS